MLFAAMTCGTGRSPVLSSVFADDRPGVDRERVEVDALGPEPHLVGGRLAGVSQLLIDEQVVRQVAEVVPDLVDVHALQPRAGLPQRVEHGDPAARVHEQHVGAAVGQAPREPVQRLPQRAIGRLVPAQKGQRAAGDQEGADGGQGYSLAAALARSNPMTALPVPIAAP